MILQRIEAAFRRQDWKTLSKETGIVFLGAFLAIQLSNWNSWRSERALEKTYVERLHKEVTDLETVRKFLNMEQVRAGTNLRRALTKLTSQQNTALTKAECYALANNPSFSNPNDNLPLLLELIPSGGLTIFKDEALREELGNFLSMRERAREGRAGITSGMTGIDQNYPELFSIRGSVARNIDLVLLDRDRFFRSVPVTCDETAMRANQAFLNDLARLELDYTFHVLGNQAVSTALSNLHVVLDGIASVQHEEPSP
ncbi:MAG: hypothetical protein AAGF33_03770 [Pseudomonadota bacterium]